jgi:antitoxin ParD1/3/4
MIGGNPNRLPQQEQEAAVELWLREDVASTYDRMMANPSRGISPEEMAERARLRHQASLR